MYNNALHPIRDESGVMYIDKFKELDLERIFACAVDVVHFCIDYKC